jgi:glycine/D-amino acid oxidase-like deaminating enzyme
VLADRLVITAGAWAGGLLADLDLPLRVLRKVLVWVDPLEPDLFRPDSFPIFSFGDQFLYGFPNIGGHGVKVAIHWDPNAPVTNADAQQPAPMQDEIEPALRVVADLLPKLAGPMPGALARVSNSKTCLYTMTPNEHFIVDRHPFEEGAYFAAGFSGHGFKYAPVIGEALADLAMSGTTELAVDFLGLKKQ